MKRFAPAATAFAFVALLAAPALARPTEIPTRSHSWSDRDSDRDDDEVRGRRHRRSIDRDEDDEDASERRQRRSVQRERRQRTVERQIAARSAQPETPIARRAITRQAEGGGLSRSCLTPATRALLGRIEAQFGPVRIISTCRPGAVIAGSGRPSKHASGQAIDFNAPSGRKGEVVRWLITNHKSGGTMTYSGMSHIHVDIGHHFVALNSGNGS